MTDFTNWIRTISVLVPIALLVSIIGWMVQFFAGDLIFNEKRKKKKKFLYCNFCGNRFKRKRELNNHQNSICVIVFNWKLNPYWFKEVIFN